MVSVGGAVRPSAARVEQRHDGVLDEHGIEPYGEEQPDGARYPDEDWELYGYLEAPGCFYGGITRGFWVVEAYPLSMDEAERDALKAELRARYP